MSGGRVRWVFCTVVVLSCGASGPGAARCEPTTGGPHWLEEGESLDVAITCASGAPVNPRDFQVEGLPQGASHDVEAGRIRWRPALDQAAVYSVVLIAPDGSRGSSKIGVADRWSDPANVPVADASRYTEEYGLPVLHLTSSAPLIKAEHVPVTVVFEGRTWSATARLRGESSLSFPKNNYTVKFDEPFYASQAGSTLSGRRALVLVTTFNDNSYVRARLAFDLWRELSPESVHLDAFSAVLFLNGAYHGIYTVLDQVSGALMARHGLRSDGNLYKAEKGDANFKLVDYAGLPKSPLHKGLEKKEGTPKEGEPGAFADAEALVEFVATSTAETFRSEAPQRINLRSYEDWWIFVNLLVARDSDVKNAYHYHDPGVTPWQYVPWDLDGTFGQSWKTKRYSSRAPLDPGDYNGMFERLLTEPAIATPMRARFRELLHGGLAAGTLQARLAALAAEVALAAPRDEARWGEAFRSYPAWSERTDFTTFEEEIQYIHQWIPRRWTVLDEQLRETP